MVMEVRNLFQSPWKIAVLSVLVLIFSLFVSSNPFYITFSPRRQFVKMDQTFVVKVLAGGRGSDKIVAADINLAFDENKFLLISAKPGDIFKNPIIIRWDLQWGKFSLAENPQNLVLGADMESRPTLLELEFMPISLGGGSKIFLGEGSLVYLYKIGPVYLRRVAGYYQIRD